MFVFAVSSGFFRGQATQKLHVRLNSPNIEVPPSQTYYECNRYEKPVKRKNKARSKAAPQEPFPLPPTLAQNHYKSPLRNFLHRIQLNVKQLNTETLVDYN